MHLYQTTGYGGYQNRTKGAASVQPLSMKYPYISIELRVIGVAGTAPKVEGVGAGSQQTSGQPGVAN